MIIEYDASTERQRRRPWVRGTISLAALLAGAFMPTSWPEEFLSWLGVDFFTAETVGYGAAYLLPIAFLGIGACLAATFSRRAGMIRWIAIVLLLLNVSMMLKTIISFARDPWLSGDGRAIFRFVVPRTGTR